MDKERSERIARELMVLVILRKGDKSALDNKEGK